MKRQKVIVIVGPTAVGKTAWSLRLAQRYNTEIISADSRQIYKEMQIGTAKPSNKELSLVSHHFVNSHSINEDFSAGQFARAADLTVKSLLVNSDTVIMVGGSGLYITAFCDGLNEIPAVPDQLRQELNDELKSKGLIHLLNELKVKDQDYFHEVDQQNPQRIIRALEIIRSTNQPYSLFRKEKTKKSHEFELVKVGLEMEREELYQRINHRMDIMIELGLFEEAEALYSFKGNNALQTVGYQEIFGYLDGEYDKQEAVRLLKRNSRRYAKRQLTWFKRDDSIHWFHPNDQNEIINYLDQL